MSKGEGCTLNGSLFHFANFRTLSQQSRQGHLFSFLKTAVHKIFFLADIEAKDDNSYH